MTPDSDGFVHLNDVFELVHLTPGQASSVLYALARDLADSDPALRAQFLAAADEAVKAPDPPATQSARRHTAE